MLSDTELAQELADDFYDGDFCLAIEAVQGLLEIRGYTAPMPEIKARDAEHIRGLLRKFYAVEANGL